MEPPAAEIVMTKPQGAHVKVEGRGEMLNLCANNYLGLANHPAVVEAAHAALDRWGYGMASVRFICGTQSLHLTLEERLRLSEQQRGGHAANVSPSPAAEQMSFRAKA